MTISDKVLRFYRNLTIDRKIPDGITVMNPYRNSESLRCCKAFYSRYYDDSRPRQLIVGINPGRFGGGLTGIPFTDPIKLERICGIPNNLEKKPEHSADFVYRLIEVFGGPQKFYSHFFIGAVCPLGFTRDGKNLNYYDMKELTEAVTNFIVQSLKQQKVIAGNPETCYCLGEGKNYAFLQKFNNQYNFFNHLVALPHPRFIMQYKRKSLENYMDRYRKAFQKNS